MPETCAKHGEMERKLDEVQTDVKMIKDVMIGTARTKGRYS